MRDNDGLVEGQPEIYMQSCEILIPKDAVKIGQTRSYEFLKFTDQNTGKMKLGIRINSYHPGELTISREKIKKILKELDNFS